MSDDQDVRYFTDRPTAAKLPAPRNLAAELVDRGDGWHVTPEVLVERLADARHELDVLRGQATDLNQRLELALTDLSRALRERDHMRAGRDQAIVDAAALQRRLTDTRAEHERAGAAWNTQRKRLRTELAAQVPGWESPAALQQAYSEMAAECEQAAAERDRRSDDLRRVLGVIEAARAWYAACDPGAIAALDVRAAGLRLAAAIDALTERGEVSDASP